MVARKTVWVDLENTPHVPFFAPITHALEEQGCRVVLTARDAYQTCEMAALYRLNCTLIGRHYGRSKFRKVLGLAIRTAQLVQFARKERPKLAISHGSRSQVVASNLLRIPSVMLDDYEHTQSTGAARPTWTIIPRALQRTSLARQGGDRVRYYDGIKEDVYATRFTPDARIQDDLGLRAAQIVVTVRPPATEAHYHNPESEVLFARFVERARLAPATKVILLPRNGRQAADIRARWPAWFTDDRVLIPASVVDGLNLLWHSDLVVSGGGTMNREAAALGVPVFSIFRGRIGAVDTMLQAEGRLHLISTAEEVDQRIALQPRKKAAERSATASPVLHQIVSTLQSILTQSARTLSQ